MSEQAVLGGAIRDTNGRHDCDSPRSHDGGVAIAAVIRLYGARFISLEVTIVPCVKFTLALWGAPPSSTIAYRAKSLAVPLKLIVVFVAVMVALPLDCIRSPVWLLPVGLLLLRMVTPSAVIVMGALVAVVPVVLAALTALTPGEPAGMVTLTPG